MDFSRGTDSALTYGRKGPSLAQHRHLRPPCLHAHATYMYSVFYYQFPYQYMSHRYGCHNTCVRPRLHLAMPLSTPSRCRLETSDAAVKRCKKLMIQTTKNTNNSSGPLDRFAGAPVLTGHLLPLMQGFPPIVQAPWEIAARHHQVTTILERCRGLFNERLTISR
jgi:hypothetical protein